MACRSDGILLESSKTGIRKDDSGDTKGQHRVSTGDAKGRQVNLTSDAYNGTETIGIGTDSGQRRSGSEHRLSPELWQR